MQETQKAAVSELKFVVDRSTAAAIRKWARRELEPDPHAASNGSDGYRITSLYFDTSDFDTFFGRASYARAKYRIRRYNDSPLVFLERKLKRGIRVFKRRSAVPLENLEMILVEADNPGYWFSRRLRHRHLRPVCRIAYCRTARIGMSPSGPLRLTLDEQISGVAIDDIAFPGSPMNRLLPDRAILELKFHLQPPEIFDRLIAEFALEPSRMSKYRWAVDAMGLAGPAESGVVRRSGSPSAIRCVG